MFDATNFSDKLTEQMLLHDYSVEELSKTLGVSQATIYNFKKGRYKQPNTNIFFSIIELFQCSSDYMLGFLEFPPEGIIYHAPIRKYGTRLKELLKERNLTQQQFIDDMKISTNLAYKWFSDKSLPTIEYLIKIANYFEISIDTLIQRTK